MTVAAPAPRVVASRPSRRGAAGLIGGLAALAATPVRGALAQAAAPRRGSGMTGTIAPGDGPPAGAPEVFAAVSRPLGNVTFTPAGRCVVSHHPIFETAVRVSEVASPTELKPFPSLVWNAPVPLTERLDAVLGLRCDAAGVVWMLDTGSRSGLEPRLVAWDTARDVLHRVLPIGAAAVDTSEPNDLVLDERRGLVFIADEGVGRGGRGERGALIAVSLADGRARRLLEGHPSTRPENRPLRVDGRELARTDKDGASHSMRVGCDGIAINDAGEWLYWGPLNGGWVYRARVADLADEALDDAALGARVERYAERPNAGGMAIDRDGNLYLTEVEGFAVGVIPAVTRRYRRLVESHDMLWPDGLAFSPDGWLHATIAQLPRAGALNGGAGNDDRKPHLLVRFRPLVPGRVGH